MAHASSPRAYHLSDRHFAMALAAGFCLHLLAFFIWTMTPREEVQDIPVRVLNIKLGDLNEAEFNAGSAPSLNSSRVEQELTRQFQPPAPPAQPQAQQPTAAALSKMLSFSKKAVENLKKQPPAITAPPQQHVRPPQPAADYRTVAGSASATPATQGSALGNSTSANAEAILRYQQVVSAWLQKFWLYPEDARRSNQQGRVTLRIRFDRRGTIRYSAVEKSSSYQTLDRAALQMVQRANPLPAAPDAYKPGEALLEFIIPVNFTLSHVSAR